MGKKTRKMEATYSDAVNERWALKTKFTALLSIIKVHIAGFLSSGKLLDHLSSLHVLYEACLEANTVVLDAATGKPNSVKIAEDWVVELKRQDNAAQLKINAHIRSRAHDSATSKASSEVSSHAFSRRRDHVKQWVENSAAAKCEEELIEKAPVRTGVSTAANASIATPIKRIFPINEELRSRFDVVAVESANVPTERLAQNFDSIDSFPTVGQSFPKAAPVLTPPPALITQAADQWIGYIHFPKHIASTNVNLSIATRPAVKKTNHRSWLPSAVNTVVLRREFLQSDQILRLVSRR